MARTDYQRTRAHVVRAGTDTAYLSIPAWCGGHIAVRVSTMNLMYATGLDYQRLLGAQLLITADLAAADDTAVDPHAFEIAPVVSRPARRLRPAA